MAADAATVRAVAALTKAKAQNKALGGKASKGGPSILSRIFDVAQRPLYGVSEGYSRLAETNNPIKMLEGIGKGVAGVKKTDMGEAILRAATADKKRGMGIPGVGDALIENKYNSRAIAGLAADVVFDPLTYTGTGVVKDVGKGAVDAARLAGLAEHFAKPETIKAIEEAGQAAKVAKEAKYAVKGVDVATKEKPIAEAVRKAEGVVRRAEHTEGLKSGEAAVAALKADKPGGKIVLKFGGKEIAGSEKLYQGASKAGKAITATKLGDAANKGFRTAAVFPELMNTFKRESELRGLAKAEQETRASLKFLKDLKPHEQDLVTHAAEAGPIKDPITEVVAKSSLHGVKADNGKDLGTYVDHFRETLDNQFEQRFKAGVFRHPDGSLKTRAEAYRENYVPHYFKNASSEEEALNKARRAIGTDRPGFNMPQKLESIAHGKSVGLDIETRADRILARSIPHGHSAIATADIFKSAADTYGVDLAGNEGRKLFTGNGGKASLAEAGYKKVDSVYIPKTMLFPSHIADSLTALEATRTSDKVAKEFMSHFDRIQNEWKFWNTAANPGHHVRNMVGDAWNNFVLGGVKNPERYVTSGKLVYGDPEKVSIKVGEKTISGPDILRYKIEAGAKPAFTMGELSEGNRNFLHGFKGKVADVAEKREDFTRTANFIEQFKQAGVKLGKDATEPEIMAAAKKAGEKVRHINIDFGDLTDFEKKYMKRIVPFYTWSRKNLPLQLEALAMHPGRVTSIPKGTAAIQRLLGTDNGYGADPLDTIPKWLKEMSPIQLGRASGGKNASFLAPALPFSDIGKFTEGGKQGVLRNLVSQTNPLMRIPVEQAFGQKAFSGTPTGGNLEYAAGQISPLNQAYKLLTGKQKLKSAQTLNYLTGAGVQEITPSQVKGELYRQQAPLKASIKKLKKKKAGG